MDYDNILKNVIFNSTLHFRGLKGVGKLQREIIKAYLF